MTSEKWYHILIHHNYLFLLLESFKSSAITVQLLLNDVNKICQSCGKGELV